MSASMAEVLEEHGSWRYTTGAGTAIVCRGCGAPVGNVIEHQAEQLAANGYGKLEDAWDEGYTAGNAHNGRRDANPYRRPE